MSVYSWLQCTGVAWILVSVDMTGQRCRSAGPGSSSSVSAMRNGS